MVSMQLLLIERNRSEGQMWSSDWLNLMVDNWLHIQDY